VVDGVVAAGILQGGMRIQNRSVVQVLEKREGCRGLLVLLSTDLHLWLDLTRLEGFLCRTLSIQIWHLRYDVQYSTRLLA
jgi:hypothetical protein